MASVRPLRGWRPRPEIAGTLACPPYDVISTAEARSIVRGNPDSFLNVIKPELHSDGAQGYRRARECYLRMKRNAVLIEDEKPCFYLYRLSAGDFGQTGVVGLTLVEEYRGGRIKKHEHTQENKVLDRLRLMHHLGAQTGPAFLAYRRDPQVDELVEDVQHMEPLYDFVRPDGVRHQFLRVESEPWIGTLERAFTRIPALYIADGHHRTEAAARYAGERALHSRAGEPPGFLSVLFPAADLRILPYNRVVRDLNGLSAEQFLQALAERAHLEPQPHRRPGPPAEGEFALYIKGEWHLVYPGRESGNKRTAGELDVTLLHETILRPILKIEDPRRDSRVQFIGGWNSERELVRVVDSGEYAAGFCIHPTRMSDVMAVADRGAVMPPKSTWFEPKLLSGLITYDLNT